MKSVAPIQAARTKGWQGMQSAIPAALLGILSACGTAFACDCPRIEPREAFARAALRADIKVAKSKRIDHFTAEGSAKIVKSWKGVVAGNRVRFRFGEHSSCELGFPKLNTVLRVAAGRDQDGVFTPRVCLSAITRPENEAILDSYARAGAETNSN